MKTDSNGSITRAWRRLGTGGPLPSEREAEAAYHEALCRFGHDSAGAFAARWHLGEVRRRQRSIGQRR